MGSDDCLIQAYIYNTAWTSSTLLLASSNQLLLALQLLHFVHLLALYLAIIYS